MELKNKRYSVLINIFFLLLFIGICTFITVQYWDQLVEILRSPDNFRKYLLSFHYYSVFVFILFQILQIVIAAIPGEMVQLAGGYVYGSFWGSVDSLFGAVLGSVFVFYISRWMGYPIIKYFVSIEKLEKYKQLVESKKIETMMFMLFLIPGIPKDILVYMAGLTPISPLKFFLIYVIARSPGIIGSAIIGANFQEKNYTVVIILSVVSLLLFVVGVFYKDKIVDKLHRKRSQT